MSDIFKFLKPQESLLATTSDVAEDGSKIEEIKVDVVHFKKENGEAGDLIVTHGKMICENGDVDAPTRDVKVITANAVAGEIITEDLSKHFTADQIVSVESWLDTNGMK